MQFDDARAPTVLPDLPTAAQLERMSPEAVLAVCTTVGAWAVDRDDHEARRAVDAMLSRLDGTVVAERALAERRSMHARAGDVQAFAALVDDATSAEQLDAALSPVLDHRAPAELRRGLVHDRVPGYERVLAAGLPSGIDHATALSALWITAHELDASSAIGAAVAGAPRPIDDVDAELRRSALEVTLARSRSSHLRSEIDGGSLDGSEVVSALMSRLHLVREHIGAAPVSASMDERVSLRLEAVRSIAELLVAPVVAAAIAAVPSDFVHALEDETKGLAREMLNLVPQGPAQLGRPPWDDEGTIRARLNEVVDSFARFGDRLPPFLAGTAAEASYRLQLMTPSSDHALHARLRADVERHSAVARAAGDADLVLRRTEAVLVEVQRRAADGVLDGSHAVQMLQAAELEVEAALLDGDVRPADALVKWVLRLQGGAAAEHPSAYGDVVARFAELPERLHRRIMEADGPEARSVRELEAMLSGEPIEPRSARRLDQNVVFDARRLEAVQLVEPMLDELELLARQEGATAAVHRAIQEGWALAGADPHVAAVVLAEVNDRLVDWIRDDDEWGAEAAARDHRSLSAAMAEIGAIACEQLEAQGAGGQEHLWLLNAAATAADEGLFNATGDALSSAIAVATRLDRIAARWMGTSETLPWEVRAQHSHRSFQVSSRLRGEQISDDDRVQLQRYVAGTTHRQAGELRDAIDARAADGASAGLVDHALLMTVRGLVREAMATSRSAGPSSQSSEAGPSVLGSDAAVAVVRELDHLRSSIGPVDEASAVALRDGAAFVDVQRALLKESLGDRAGADADLREAVRLATDRYSDLFGDAPTAEWTAVLLARGGLAAEVPLGSFSSTALGRPGPVRRARRRATGVDAGATEEGVDLRGRADGRPQAPRAAGELPRNRAERPPRRPDDGTPRIG